MALFRRNIELFSKPSVGLLAFHAVGFPNWVKRAMCGFFHAPKLGICQPSKWFFACPVATDISCWVLVGAKVKLLGSQIRTVRINIIAANQ